MSSPTVQLHPETGLTALARAIFPTATLTSEQNSARSADRTGSTTAEPSGQVADRVADRVAEYSVRVAGPATDCRRACNLGEFQPTTLAALAGVSLLNRVDTKYLVPVAQLPGMLSTLAQSYSVLDVDGVREHPYQTVYFDTPDFALYRDHHAGRAVRHKVRSRTYLDSGRSFFEIKTKTDAGRTIKYRFETAAPMTDLTPAAQALLAEHLPPEEQSLQPTIRNDFRRVTLVGLHTAERLTLDLGVQFEHEGQTAVLPGIVVAELKQSGIDRGSPFAQLMQRRRIRPTSLSKYCVGVAMLQPHIVEGGFAGQLQAIEAVAVHA
jgi:hypothetical protein